MNHPPALAALVCVHGRHRISRAAIASILEAGKRAPLGWEIRPFVVLSPEDIKEGFGVWLESAGIPFVSRVNNPVSFKFQYGLTMLRKLMPHHKAVVILGSDDFASAGYWRSIIRRLDAGETEPFGLEGCWLLNVDTLQAGFYCPRDQTIGAGRVYPIKALNDVAHTLWKRACNSGLDACAHGRMLFYGHPILPWHDPDCFVVDVKTAEGNIHTWDIFWDGKNRNHFRGEILEGDATRAFLDRYGFAGLLEHRQSA